MVEEVRFFVRVGLITLVIAVIYWFVSYEIVGTVLLVGVAVGVVTFVACIAGRAPTRRRDAGAREGSIVRRAVSSADRVIGFDERHDLADAGALHVADDPLPRSSIWPPATALAATIAALGLLYGGWFWLPGAAMGAVVAWGWVKQLDA